MPFTGVPGNSQFYPGEQSPGFVNLAGVPQTFDPSTAVTYQVISTRAQDVTPPRRYRTLASEVFIALPEFQQLQQVNLVGQGFNRRNMGIVTITGVPQPLSIFVKGTDRSASLLVETAEISKQLGTTGTLNVRFTMLTTDSFRPSFGDSIVLSEFGKRRFAGYIDEIDFTVYPGTNRLDYLCKCSGWESILQRRIITGVFPAARYPSLFVMVTALNVMLAENLTLDTTTVDATLALTDDYTFDYIKFSDAFNQLALATDTVWWVDNYQRIHFQKPVNMQASSYAIADNNGKQIDSITVTQSLANYRNRQYVKASTNILSQSVTLTESHTFTGVRHPDPVNGPLGIDIVCLTSYPLASQPQSVKENNVEITGTPRFFELKFDGTVTAYPPAGEDGYYWMQNSFGIFHWPPSQNPTPGTTLSVTYTGTSAYQGNVVVYSDAAEIANLAAKTGGTGIFEEIEQYQGTGTYQQLIDLAKGIEVATAPVPTQFVANTIEQIEDIGYLVSVNLAKYGINETLAIQQIRAKSFGANMGKGTTFQSMLTLVSQKTLGDWRSWFERLLAKIQAQSSIGPNEIATFTLAADVPGTLSTGLAVGAFGSAYAVTSPAGQIVSVSLCFLTAADANIVINIFVNGVSIFPGGNLPTYAPADTGNTRFFNAFVKVPFNVVQGDQITLSVVGCGNVNPGKNGTVSVTMVRKS